MCLYSIKRAPYIADRGITCYKLVSVRGGKYYTPYVGRRIAKRYIIGRDLYCAHGKSAVKSWSNAWDAPHFFANSHQFFAVGKGFIHTYGRVDVAFSKMGLNREVYECIIPKGAAYYKDYETCELASTAIRFVRRIEPRYEKIKF
jgi:hypothetical protein